MDYAACRPCTLAAVYASLGPTTVALVAETAEGASGTTRLLAFDAQGRQTASVDVSSILGAEPSFGSMKLYARSGHLVATLGRRAASFDSALTRLAGPWSLPAAAEIDEAPKAIAIGWIGSLDGEVTDGGAAAVAELGDLLVEARPTSRATRVTTSSRVLLVRRDEDRVAVLHGVEGATYFSLVASDGTKRGGDLFLGPMPVALAPVDPATRSYLVVPRDRNHFVVWAGEDAVTRETITCDP
jgi:hypothetical protein